jgi:hypothetical protein
MRTCTPQKVGWGVVFGKTPAFRQHQDSITINNGVNAVGDSQNSAVMKNAAHGSLNQLVCVSIHSGCCLVHHNDTRPSTKSTGDFNNVCGPYYGHFQLHKQFCDRIELSHPVSSCESRRLFFSNIKTRVQMQKLQEVNVKILFFSE